MPKQPWRVEVTIESDEAVGLILRRLHEMPGVSDIRPIMDSVGGTGPGAKRIEKAASASRAKANGPNLQEAVLRYLVERDSPARLREVVEATGRLKSSVMTALYQLKQSGVVKSAERGVYEVAVRPQKATQQRQPQEAQVLLPERIALPAPARTASGRLPQGTGATLMLVILMRHAAPLPSLELRQQMASQGLGVKSISGIVGRAVRDRLIRRTGVGNKTIYELTSKGQHTAAAAEAWTR